MQAVDATPSFSARTTMEEKSAWHGILINRKSTSLTRSCRTGPSLPSSRPLGTGERSGSTSNPLGKAACFRLPLLRIESSPRPMQADPDRGNSSGAFPELEVITPPERRPTNDSGTRRYLRQPGRPRLTRKHVYPKDHRKAGYQHCLLLPQCSGKEGKHPHKD